MPVSTRSAYLADEPRLRRTLREELKGAPDLARALARLAFGRGGPRDLGAVARCHWRVPALSPRHLARAPERSVCRKS